MPSARVRRTPLGAASDWPEGAARSVRLLPGRDAYVFRFRGQLRAFLNRCPHMGGPVDFEPADGQLVCRWHGATFDAVGGARLDGQAGPGSALPALRIETVDGAPWLVWEVPEDPFSV